MSFVCARFELLTVSSSCSNDSGCVTSAETVLINAQSVGEFAQHVSVDKKRTVVVSISPQSIASVAARHELSLFSVSVVCRISPQREPLVRRLCLQTFRKLVTLFRSIGADFVLDASFATDIALLELFDEFLERKRRSAADATALPLLTSECPGDFLFLIRSIESKHCLNVELRVDIGWICYAEKNKDAALILPHISAAKSPQAVCFLSFSLDPITWFFFHSQIFLLLQLMGIVAKRLIAKQLGLRLEITKSVFRLLDESDFSVFI